MANRKPSQSQAAARQAAQQAATDEATRKAAARRTTIRLGILVGLIAIVTVIAFAVAGGDDDNDDDTATGDDTTETSGNDGASGEGEGEGEGDDDDDLLAEVETFRVPSANHVSGTVDYPQTPPVGGDHNQVWLNCGAYDEPVPNEMAVHALEHGAVWITYESDLPAAEVESLDARAEQTYIVVSPWEGDDLPSPVVASAWGVQLQLQSADDPSLGAFIERYRGADSAPEPGAPCTGGVGDPL